MRIDGDDAPDDFISSCPKFRQRNVQQRVVGAIQMHIAFVHFFPRRVENLNAAKGGFDIVSETDSNLVWGCLDRTAYTWFRALEKSVCFEPGQAGQNNQ